METYTLSNGITIPKIGFGTWQIPEGEEAYNSVSFALKAGYTHIDTAQIYGNEVSVGKAIADSDVAREDLFLTTKLWNDKHDYDLAKASIDESLERLGVDYLDLFLMNKSDPAAATIAIPAIVKSAIPLPPVAGRSNPLLLTTVSGTSAVLLSEFF